MRSTEITAFFMSASKETPKLPEGEDIKQEVWSQLGRMVGHTNMISANLLHLYTPVELVEEVQDLEEDIEGVPAEPQKMMPECSLAPNKVACLHLPEDPTR